MPTAGAARTRRCRGGREKEGWHVWMERRIVILQNQPNFTTKAVLRRATAAACTERALEQRGRRASDRSSRAASSGVRRVRVAHDERAALRRVQKGEGGSDAGAPRATAAP